MGSFYSVGCGQLDAALGPAVVEKATTDALDETETVDGGGALEIETVYSSRAFLRGASPDPLESSEEWELSDYENPRLFTDAQLATVAPFYPMKAQFATDFAFEAALRSQLSVESCSLCAQTYVCIDVVNIIVQMLSPRIATIEEMQVVDWSDEHMAVIHIALFEMKRGKVLAEGCYLRAAIAHFGLRKLWYLCTTYMFQIEAVLGVYFCMVDSKVRPNETVFGLTIPPKGHPLRKYSIANPNLGILLSFPNALVSHMSVHHSVDAKLDLLRSLEQFIGCETEWKQMLLRPHVGIIPATIYLWRCPKEKVSKRVFRALLPAEISVTDAAFWYKHSGDTLDCYRRHSVGKAVVNDFKNWVGPEAVAALRRAETEMKQGTHEVYHL